MKRRLLTATLVVMLGLMVTVFSNGNNKAHASDKVYSIRLSHQYAPTTSFQKTCEWWKKQLEERSNGRIKVEIFPASQLMPVDQQFSAMLDGRIQASTCNAAAVASFDESFSIFEMPFLFGNSYDSIKNISKFVKTDEFQTMVIDKLKKKGILCYPAYLDGAREIITTKVPVKSLDDLKGLKLRSTGGRFSELTGRTFGFSAIAISAAELPTALMQGTVDGAMLNPVYVYEVKSPVKYFTVIPFDYTAVDPILLSKRFYDTLPDDLKGIVDGVSAELFDWSAEYIEPLIDYSYKMIQEDMKCELFTLSDEDMAKAASMAPIVWDAYVKQIAGGDVLLKIAKEITFGK